MHKTIAEALHFAKELIPQIKDAVDEVGLAVPATCLHSLAQVCKESSLQLGTQNIHSDKEGAFTGEISAEMAVEAGATFTLIGHSERRHLFGETDRFIHKKVSHALQSGLKVILCVGETSEEKNDGLTQKVLLRQLQEGLEGVDSAAMTHVSIAYEPVWAIGTGVAANPATAQECHAFCRKLIEQLYGTTVSNKVKILYGGSVQVENVGSFLEKPDIDGVLVGKGSLTSQSFARILNFRQH